MDMFFRILKKDLKRKKTINLILLLFIILATMFLASSVNNLIAVSGAIDYFIEISKVPDYFTISVSEGKEDVIGDYLAGNENLSEYEVIDAFNVTDEQVRILECALEPGKSNYEKTNMNSIQAIPNNFMKVFTIEDEPLWLEKGEIALSKLEAEENALSVGDKMSIKIGEIEQEFTIAAIVKDVMFGSPMVGFKRMIISQEDFDRYASQEKLVYTHLYSVNFTDEKSFMSDWNQQSFNVMTSIDGSVVRMCYIMDMLVTAILIIISICLILIAFLVLRFTIVFTLQEDYKEIGIMKAIGICETGIRSIYLIKYLALSILGAMLGLLASFPFGDLLLKQTVVNIVVKDAQGTLMIPILCAVFIVIIVLGFCYWNTGKLRKYSAMDAIRNGSNGERYHGKSGITLRKRAHMSPPFYLAINDICSSLKRFLILAVTFCLGTMLILVPLSAGNTLQSDGIIYLFSMSASDAYLDNKKMDLYMAEENIDMLETDLQEIEVRLKQHNIEAYTGVEVGYLMPCHAGNEEEAVTYNILQSIGSWERSFELLEGREPVAENEVIITDLTAREMGVGIGDSIYFQQSLEEKEYIITGTYQSMMNLGKGFRVSRQAKIGYEYFSGIFCVQVEIPGMESEEAQECLTEIFPDYKVQSAQEFINAMIGGIMDQIDTVMLVIAGIVLLINSLITILTMKSLMTKERGDIALLKSMGFRNSAVRKWQTLRIMIILVAAIVFGTVLSNLLAPFIIGPIFAMMGGNHIKLVMDPLEAYVIYPLLLLSVTGLSAAICAGAVRRVELREINTME